MNQDFQLGLWLVHPSLNSISRNGNNLRLEPKAMEVLVCLAEHGGSVVSKEKLIAEVWADTFVGDDALIRCISGLRRALEDDPKFPRIIETIPKRGYRLLEKVELLAPVVTAQSKPEKNTARSWALAIVAVVIVVAVAAFFYAQKRRPPTEFDTVLLADFDNRTGDPVFDDTLKQALAAGLQQSPAFNIISDQKIGETLHMMGRSPRERLNEETARDLCQRVGSKVVLSGSIASVGSHYAIGLTAVNCVTGDSLNRQAVEVETKEQVLNALGRETTKLRQELGESLISIQRFDVPLWEVTTPSLDALKAFSTAEIARFEKGDSGAIPFLKRAIELDPNFALAHATLATFYESLQQPSQSRESMKKAYDLRDRVSQWERFYIESHYYAFATGELEKANQVYEMWGRTYPHCSGAPNNSGIGHALLGQYEKAVAETLEALRREPRNYAAYENLIALYTILNRLDDARATYQKAMESRADYPPMHVELYGIDVVGGDTEGMRRQVDWAIGKTEYEHVLFSAQADTEAFYGRLGEAREFSRRAIESAKRDQNREAAALWQINGALREAVFGNGRRARQGAVGAMTFASTRDVQTVAAFLLAQTGNTEQAQKMSDDLARRYPLDTLINGYWLPTIRAAIELDLNHPAEAIEVLQAAGPYELGAVVSAPLWVAPLYPAYVRGQAYLMLHQGKEAAAEYQKFLDHPGAVGNFPLGALARLGLARAYAMQEEPVKARNAYQDFLTLWKDADPDIPILMNAKAEYAKLH